MKMERKADSRQFDMEERFTLMGAELNHCRKILSFVVADKSKQHKTLKNFKVMNNLYLYPVKM